MNVAICVPCLDFCPTPFTFCLATLMATPQKDSLGRPIRIGLMHHQGSILMEARKVLTSRAIASGATHMLFLDSDMHFPPLTIQRLAAHGVEIALASYVKRFPPHELLGVMSPPDACTSPPRKGLAQMELAPLGVSLLKLSIFPSIEEPWFEYRTSLEGVTWSEDSIWCLKARKAGHTIWMDVNLTRELGHVGIQTYRLKEPIQMDTPLSGQMA